MKNKQIILVPILMIILSIFVLANEQTIEVKSNYLEPSTTSQPQGINTLFSFLGFTTLTKLSDHGCIPIGAYSLSTQGTYNGATINYVSKDAKIVNWSSRPSDLANLGGKCSTGQFIEVIECSKPDGANCQKVFKDVFVKSTSTDVVNVQKLEWVQGGRYVGYTCWDASQPKCFSLFLEAQKLQGTFSGSLSSSSSSSGSGSITLPVQPDIIITSLEVQEVVTKSGLLDTPTVKVKVGLKNYGGQGSEKITLSTVSSEYFVGASLSLREPFQFECYNIQKSLPHPESYGVGVPSLSNYFTVSMSANEQSFVTTELKLAGYGDYKVVGLIGACPDLGAVRNSAGREIKAVYSKSVSVVKGTTVEKINVSSGETITVIEKTQDTKQQAQDTKQEYVLKQKAIKVEDLASATSETLLQSVCATTDNCVEGKCASKKYLVEKNYMSSPQIQTFDNYFKGATTGALTGTAAGIGLTALGASTAASAGAGIAGTKVGVTAANLCAVATLGVGAPACIVGGAVIGTVVGLSFVNWLQTFTDVYSKSEKSGFCVIESTTPAPLKFVEDIGKSFLPQEYQEYGLLAGIALAIVLLLLIGRLFK